ncbi:MAG: response regulator transcription factor [Eubacteriaceae bacterium]|jgi:DNA-binding response OmpR family regulator|nr:response regulator transcription factor [Eubacteriaceae bacterium]
MRVLLIEDEAGIAKPLVKILEKNGLPTDAVYDGMSGYIQASKRIYDVVILDLMLPEMDGLELLRRMRSEKVFTPVLILTAKDSVDDRVAGLEIGADDYLSKPFYPMEVVARVRALARRRADLFSGIDALEFADIQLDVANAVATVGDATESLTAKESQILELLMKNAGNAISKDMILDMVWGVDSEATENTVEIYIHYLRKKLEPSKKAKIVTIRRLGYSLREV